jgi:hypothetical protein
VESKRTHHTSTSNLYIFHIIALTFCYFYAFFRFFPCFLPIYIHIFQLYFHTDLFCVFLKFTFCYIATFIMQFYRTLHSSNTRICQNTMNSKLFFCFHQNSCYLQCLSYIYTNIYGMHKI